MTTMRWIEVRGPQPEAIEVGGGERPDREGDGMRELAGTAT